MAFSFGGAATSTPAASTGFSFGGSSAATPASGGFSFGGAAAPATSTAGGGFSFGTPPAATSAAPPAASGGFAFGAPATSAAPAFSFSSAPAAASTSLFGAPAAAAQPAQSFGFGAPQQQAQAAQPQQLSRATRFEELDKGTQDKLLQIQEQISRYSSDQQKVLQLPHLQGNTAVQQGLDADTSSVSAELRLLQARITAEGEGLDDFREKAIELLKATEVVVRTFERYKLWRDFNTVQRNEPLTPMQQAVLNAPVVLPGPFLEDAVAGLSAKVAEYRGLLDEVEQVMAASSLQELPQGEVDIVTALPNIVSNLHDYFISVAAKLERTHAAVQKHKAAYLARLRAQGITTDPFERLRRQEQHAAAQAAAQQQRLAGGAGMAQLQGGGAGGVGVGALVPAGGAGAGGMFGGSAQAAAAPAVPGLGGGAAPFGSPFPSATPFGAGAATNGGLSRSNSKARSGKKR